jgi:hypothetical protein
MSAVEARRGRLPAPHSSVSVSAHPYTWGTGAGAIDTYWGTLESLLAARCASEQLLKGRKRGVRSEDENGHWYRLLRSPTKTTQDRLKLVRHVHSVPLAAELPGVRELFPEGLPVLLFERPELDGGAGKEPEQAENLADWAERARSGLRLIMWASLASLESSIARASGVASEHEDSLPNIARPDRAARFRWAPGEIERVRQFFNATQRRFETLLDSMRADDRNRLRLLVFH